MALLHVPLDQIDEARLQALIDAGAAESRIIDYKRTTYGNAHSDYSELLADTSSFANTAGGDLILGMEAVNGIPTAFTPFVDPTDPEILRLEQVVRGGLQPRIANVAFRAVPIRAGGAVLVIRIPRSYQAPHRVTRQGSNRFWARSAAGKYEPDVTELRALFSAAPQLAQRVRDFRIDRVAKIAAGAAPVPLMYAGALIVHVVPFSAFDVGSDGLPLAEIQRDFRAFVPIGSSTAQGSRINFEGILKTLNAEQQATQHRAYVQLHRNGIVETVDSSLVNTSTQIITFFDDKIIGATMRSLRDLAAVGVGPPYAVLASVIGVTGTRLSFVRGARGWPDELSDPLDRDQYHFDEVILETIPADLAECAGRLRLMLDQAANTGGRATSPIFDAQGRYIPPGR
jgi:Putative DNA-binding domain